MKTFFPGREGFYGGGTLHSLPRVGEPDVWGLRAPWNLSWSVWGRHRVRPVV